MFRLASVFKSSVLPGQSDGPAAIHQPTGSTGIPLVKKYADAKASLNRVLSTPPQAIGMVARGQFAQWANLFDLSMGGIKNDKKIVEDLVNSGFKGSVVEIGAGVGIADLLYRYSGASEYIQSTDSPYSREARNHFLNRIPGISEASVSAEMAYELAVTAYEKTIEVYGATLEQFKIPVENRKKPFGLSVTAVTNSVDQKRKPNSRFYLCCYKGAEDFQTLVGNFRFQNRMIQQLVIQRVGVMLLHQMLTQNRVDLDSILTPISSLVELKIT